MKLFDLFKGDEVENNISEENKQMRKKVKNYKIAYEDVRNDRDLWKDKYLKILEEKGEGFTQYLYYKNLYTELNQDAKDTKKIINGLQSDINSLKLIIGEFYPKVQKYIPVMSKCKNIGDFMSNLLMFYCTGKELPLKSAKNACKRLKISKDQIKKCSNYLYQELKIDEWEIDKKEELLK